MKLHKILKILDIFFLLYFVIIIFFAVFVKNDFNNIDFVNIIKIISSEFSTLNHHFRGALFLIYLGIRKGLKDFNYTKKDISDNDKKYIYYRNLIKQYNIGTLSFLDNHNLDYDVLCTSTILELEYKKIITIKNGIITVLKTPESEIEKKFVASLKDNKFHINPNTYIDYIIMDAKKNDLIINNLKKNILKKLLVNNIIYYCILCLFETIQSNLYDVLSNMYDVLFLLLYLVIIFCEYGLYFGSAYFSVFFVNYQKNPFIRSPKGIEINHRLEGLKCFLEDFSNVKEKKADNLLLREEYLIYSVAFNQNKKIIDEYSNYYKLI